MLSEETAIQQMMHGVNMFPLELFPAKNPQLCLSGARHFAIIPGNVALCEPVDLTQNVHASMNGATL